MTRSDLRAKSLGAYYTNPLVARYLVRWAIRNAADTVLDPSFGEGVFLEAALDVLSASATAKTQVFGVEYDKGTYQRAKEVLSDRIDPCNILCADFFDVTGGPDLQGFAKPDLPSFDVVVGNPPFIRYHRFNGKARLKAQKRSRHLGIELNGLSSSWAHFVVHSVSFLKADGRLAMVLPAEFMHASYAGPVVKFLADSFRSIRVLTFRKKLFPDLSEDTILALGEGKGITPVSFSVTDLESVDALTGRIQKGRPVDIQPVVKGLTRLMEYLLPDSTRQLYTRLKSDERVTRLADIADVGIGYVTGNNDFFHLTEKESREYAIPEEFMLPCIRRSSQLKGIFFTKADWKHELGLGEAVLLLHLAGRQGRLPQPIRRYLTTGEQQGVPKAYKCRNRNPWWVVPNVYACDGFLTYMSGNKAQLVVNQAGAVARNTLHIVRLHKPNRVEMMRLAVSWLTSLTTLSTEIEGHSLGGGMLKLEPGEAARTLVPLPTMKKTAVQELAKEVDSQIRAGQWETAQSLADQTILLDGMGLRKRDVSLLRNGAKQLRLRRYSR